MLLRASLTIVAILGLIGCRTPGEFEVAFTVERNEYGDGFDRLVRCLGLDPESEGHVSGPLTHAEALAFKGLFEQVNRGRALTEDDFNGVPCRADRAEPMRR